MSCQVRGSAWSGARTAASLCCLAVVFAIPVWATKAGQPADRDWPYYGGDQGGLKYSSVADINRSNVGQLALAWGWQTGEEPLPQYATSPGMFEATPVMVAGVLYLSTPYNRVVALDPESGHERWSYDPKAYVAGQVPNGTG